MSSRVTRVGKALSHPLTLLLVGAAVPTTWRSRLATSTPVSRAQQGPVAGRVEVEARSGSSGGRVTFVLEDAQRHRHYYNAMAGPRLPPWARHRFDPY